MNFKIKIFDNKIPYCTRDILRNHCLNSTYTLGWADSDDTDLNVHSTWSIDDMNALGLMPYINSCINETQWFENKKLTQIIVNLVQSGDIHYIHTHNMQQVILIYVNMEWKDGWYGETLFYNPDDITDIIFTSSYIPGRIILFDGTIPHAIRPPSPIASKFRYSLTFLYDK